MSKEDSKPSIPGAGSSVLWGLVGLVLFAVPLVGVACGIVAIVKAQKARALLQDCQEEYLGEATARLGFRLGVTAVIFAHLCYLVVAAWLRLGMVS